MLRLERAPRKEVFEGLTPGWILGVFLYLCAIFLIFHFSQRTGVNMKPCLLWQTLRIPCPLCGGTTASMELLSGRPDEAIRWNPLVVLGIAAGCLWVVIRLGFGIRLSSKRARPWLAAIAFLLVAANWIYLLMSYQSS